MNAALNPTIGPEIENLYSQKTKIADELEKILKEHLKNNQIQDPTNKIELNEEMKIRLQALGYMDQVLDNIVFYEV